MKKSIILLTIFILLTSISLTSIMAQDMTELEQNAEKIKKNIDKLPLDEQGNIDQTKLVSYKSAAEQRIAKINSWLDKNAKWLNVIFGMKPAISWVFFLNLFMIICFLVFIRNSLNFSTFSDTTCIAIAFILTIIMIQLRLFSMLSEKIIGLFSKWWFYLIVIIVFIVLSGISGQLGKLAEEWKKKRAEKKVQKIAENAEDVEKGARDARLVSGFAEGIKNFSESVSEESEEY